MPRKQDWSPRMDFGDNAFANFARRHGITAKVREADSNPWMEDNDWARTAGHWKVTFLRAGKRMSANFSQGSAHKEPPKPAEVLESLSMDAGGIEGNRDFEEWAREYGYEVDSRKAERTYKLTRKIASDLKKFLGPDLYKELLYKIDDYGER